MKIDRPQTNIRLPHASYAVRGSLWHVTLGMAFRYMTPFVDLSLAMPVLTVLPGTSLVTGAPIHLACLMPDHAHLLIEVGDRNLKQVLTSIKLTTTHTWWDAGGTGNLWQRSWHDHGIRTEHEYHNTVQYILNNPVNAGLVATWTDYPLFTGTLLRDLLPTANP